MRKLSLNAGVVALTLLVLCGSAPAGQWNAQEAYDARVAELKRAVAENPKDAGPAAELAAFYLEPRAARDVECIDGEVRRVMVPLRPSRRMMADKVSAFPWTFRGDPDLAAPYLAKAMELDLNHPLAVRTAALLLRMRGNFNAMWPHVKQVLERDPLDLDMCRLYLDHELSLARNLEEEAEGLRYIETRDEQRGDKLVRVTRYPTALALERADAIDARAKRVRWESARPLNRAISTLEPKDPATADPKTLSQSWLAWAYHYQLIGDLKRAAPAADKSLRADPTNTDALVFLAELQARTGDTKLLGKYKALQDKWLGADSTPLAPIERKRGPRR